MKRLQLDWGDGRGRAFCIATLVALAAPMAACAQEPLQDAYPGADG
jgi:hypothetical protein